MTLVFSPHTHRLLFAPLSLDVSPVSLFLFNTRIVHSACGGLI